MFNKNRFLTFSKWLSLVIIIITISFLILTFIISNGFTFFDEWTTSSSNSILTEQNSSSGPGPLQKNLVQILIALFGGGALGVAGALLQKVTKNRLAEVSILGIGSLNILFIYGYALLLPEQAFGNGIWAILMPIFLIIVSVFGTLIIWAITRSKMAHKNTFVIVGIALQLFVEALSVVIVNPSLLIKGLAGSNERRIWDKINGYTLGQIRNEIDNPLSNPVSWWLIGLSIGIILLVFVALLFLRKKIDTMETSEKMAITTGINVKRLKLVMYLLVALLAGVAAAILGSVALLGIIAPSLARLLFKNKAWSLMVGSFLIGGIMVLFASFLAIQLQLDVAVGILATAITIPYFLFLMIKEQ